MNGKLNRYTLTGWTTLYTHSTIYIRIALWRGSAGRLMDLGNQLIRRGGDLRGKAPGVSFD